MPEMYAQGMTTIQIAEKVGLSPGAVHSALKARGVQMRSYSDGIKAHYPEGRKGEQASHWKGGRRKAPTYVRKYYKAKLATHWKGGRLQTPQGYIYVHTPDHPNATKDGYVMEHRLVMEKKLGRLIDRTEVVHHLNGTKGDNRPENLAVAKRGEHVALHFDAFDELQKVKAELERYRQQYGELP